MDEEKYKKVESWLGSVYGSESVPQYEIEALTVDSLYQLAITCERADSMAQLTVRDLDGKAAEYAAETEYLASVLDVLRVRPEDLSSSAQSQLRVLTDLACSLNLKDASDTSYLIAMTSLGRELIKMADSREKILRIGGSLHEKTKNSSKKAAVLEKTLKVLEEQCELQAKTTSNRVKEAKFMRGKAREYGKTLESYSTKLPAQYVSHQTLQARAEQLDSVHRRLAPLRSRLNGYHSLPPNINLTKVRIEETRREIAAIEEELARIVSQI